MTTASPSIVDVHVHLGASSALSVGGSPEDLLRLMDFNGIEAAILSPIPGQPDPDGVASTREQNDAIAQARDSYPDRFPRILAAAEPRHGAPALAEVDRVLSDLGFSGLSFHHDFQGFALDHENSVRLIERASAHTGTVIHAHTAIHSWLEAPFQLTKVARQFPDVTFINAHAFMDPQQTSFTIEQARDVPNLYFDTCVSQKYGFPIELAVQHIGADRLLFGSDIPYFADKCLDLDLVTHADISAGDRELILGANARRIFGLEN